MSITYCDRLDITSILGEAALIACIDDETPGIEPIPDGNNRILDAIQRAAVEMNGKLRNQYRLTSLITNDWCKWCNAYIAAFHLQSRRGNSPIPSVVDAVQSYRDSLEEIRWGRFQIPEQVPDFDSSPAVTTYNVELKNNDGAVPVNTDMSTGQEPQSTTTKRNRAGRNWGYGWY